MSVGAKRKYKNCEKSGHGLSSVGGLVLLCVGDDWAMLPFVVEWTVSSAIRRMKKKMLVFCIWLLWVQTKLLTQFAWYNKCKVAKKENAKWICSSLRESTLIVTVKITIWFNHRTWFLYVNVTTIIAWVKFAILQICSPGTLKELSTTPIAPIYIAISNSFMQDVSNNWWESNKCWDIFSILNDFNDWSFF